MTCGCIGLVAVAVAVDVAVDVAVAVAVAVVLSVLNARNEAAHAASPVSTRALLLACWSSPACTGWHAWLPLLAPCAVAPIQLGLP